MPHKHKRKAQDISQHNLPPSSNHTKQSPTRLDTISDSASKKRKIAKSDDTPRAFTRILQRRAHLKHPQKEVAGSGTASAPAKKPSRRQEGRQSQLKHPKNPGDSALPDSTLSINPKERLGDFSARVDASLPLSKLVRRDDAPLKVGHKEFKTPQTKTEKKMQRMQALWREEQRRRKERDEDEQDERDLEEVGREEYKVSNEMAGWAIAKAGPRSGGVGVGKKRKKTRDDDPWAILEKKRERARFGDVVQRPPDLRALRGAKLKAG